MADTSLANDDWRERRRREREAGIRRGKWSERERGREREREREGGREGGRERGRERESAHDCCVSLAAELLLKRVEVCEERGVDWRMQRGENLQRQ